MLKLEKKKVFIGLCEISFKKKIPTYTQPQYLADIFLQSLKILTSNLVKFETIKDDNY